MRDATKAERAVIARFAADIAELVQAQGGGPGKHRRWLVHTAVGELELSPNDPDDVFVSSLGLYIHCRFKDVARAAAHGTPVNGLRVDLLGVPLNPYSGKWNWYEWAPAGSRNQITDEMRGALVERFTRALSALCFLFLPEKEVTS